MAKKPKQDPTVAATVKVDLDRRDQANDLERRRMRVAPGAAPSALVRFDFHGDALDVVPLEGGDVGVSLRRLCEVLPLAFGAQVRRLEREAAKGARWAAVVKMATTGADGKTYEMVLLPRRSIPMFAATVSLGHLDEAVRPGVTAKLARYHDDCAEVLADHFIGRRERLDPKLEARVGQLEAALANVRPSASDHAVIGRAAARINILAPLRIAVHLQARAFPAAEQAAACRKLWKLQEDRLRHALHFPRAPSHKWESFPSSRLGEASLAVAQIAHEAHVMAGLVFRKPAQLRMALPEPPKKPAGSDHEKPR